MKIMYLLKKRGNESSLHKKRDSSHSSGMTNIAVISTEGRNLFYQEPLGYPGLLRRYKIMVLMGLFFLFPLNLFSAVVLFQPEVGSKYDFDLAVTQKAEIGSFNFKASAPLEMWKSISLNVLAFRSGLYVLDIIEGKNRFRRFVRPNCQVFLAPTERTAEIPFIFTYPDTGLEIGKVHGSTANIIVGNKSFPAQWTIKAEPGVSENIVSLGFSGKIDLPTDRIISRKLEVEGKMDMEAQTGVPISGNWEIKYSLQVSNKEVAVTRNIWSYQETRKFVLSRKVK